MTVRFLHECLREMRRVVEADEVSTADAFEELKDDDSVIRYIEDTIGNATTCPIRGGSADIDPSIAAGTVARVIGEVAKSMRYIDPKVAFALAKLGMKKELARKIEVDLEGAMQCVPWKDDASEGHEVKGVEGIGEKALDLFRRETEKLLAAGVRWSGPTEGKT